jgi:hypothetical protein
MKKPLVVFQRVRPRPIVELGFVLRLGKVGGSRNREYAYARPVVIVVVRDTRDGQRVGVDAEEASVAGSLCLREAFFDWNRDERLEIVDVPGWTGEGPA